MSDYKEEYLKYVKREFEDGWENLKITSDQVGDLVGNARVIYLPKNSKYGGFYFFHPAKLIRKQSYYYTFGFTEDFKFTIKKNGKGRYNKFEVLEEKTLSASEIKEAYKNQQNIK